MLVTILGAANEPRVHEIAIGTNGRDVLGPADGATGRCDRTVAGAPARWLLRQLGRRGIRGEGPGDYPLVYARNLRLQLAREHVDRLDRDDANLCEPLSAFRAFACSAAALDKWYAKGRTGPRPPGRLRLYHAGHLPRWIRTWARPIYRHVFDPDGRPSALRRSHAF